MIRWPVNKEAPFRFSFSEQLKVYTKSDYDFNGLAKLIEGINPDVIVCSGWIDKDYLKLVKPYSGKIPTVMTCDTHWRGDLKQRLAVIAGRVYLSRLFSHAWVPGQAQKEYVRRLGFAEDAIQLGFYSCDLPFFEAVYQEQFSAKRQQFPKRFLFVGRYYEFKGVRELWQAFIELQQETPNDWELWCLGAGDVEPVQHPSIKHLGFVQPTGLRKVTAQTGVFVLPSRFEPWGVVVHEFAASGFPLLLSREVGAKERFLQAGKNGAEFAANDVAAMKAAFRQIMNTSETELIAMGERSHQLAMQVSPQTWSRSLLTITGTQQHASDRTLL